MQTDDLAAVERAVRQFVPRLPGQSQGSLVSPPRGGWIAVYDDVCDRDPSMLRRLATELSDRMGAVVLALGVEHDEVVRFVLLEAGRVVDEYLSVPEHYGHLPPGDVIALAANPRVVSRLTGADPAAVRAVARTAAFAGRAAAARELLAGDRGRDRARRHRARLGGRAGARRRRPRGALVIVVYDAARCPYCARVRIVLAEKGVAYDPVEIDLRDRPAWLYEKNPAGKVPVLEEDGWVLPESAVISEYLNERYPEPPLWPDDPGERAAGRLLVFRFDDFSRPYYAFRRGEEGARERFEDELGVPRRPARGDALAVRPRVRARRRRVPAVGRARPRHARVPARAVAGARGLARAGRRAAVGGGGARARRGAVTTSSSLHALPLDERMWERGAT